MNTGSHTQRKGVTIKVNADKTGIASAILCTVHCLVVPAYFLLQKWWVTANTTLLPGWWEWLDYAFLLISFSAVYHASTHAGNKLIKISLWISWIVLAIGILVPQLHWVTYLASAGLIATHFINLRQITNKRKVTK